MASWRIFIPELQCFYVAISKNCSTSMEQLLMNAYGEPTFDAEDEPREALIEFMAPRRCTREAILESAFPSFTIVRNPYDRLVSAWSHLTRTGRRTKVYDFPSCVRCLHKKPFAADNHYRPQMTRLTCGGKPIVDHIVRYERLEEDWAKLQDLIGIGPLPKLRVGQHEHYSEYYTPELRYIAQGFYWQDLQLLGYNFEGDFTPTIPLLEATRV